MRWLRLEGVAIGFEMLGELGNSQFRRGEELGEVERGLGSDIQETFIIAFNSEL